MFFSANFHGVIFCSRELQASIIPSLPFSFDQIFGFPFIVVIGTYLMLVSSFSCPHILDTVGREIEKSDSGKFM